MSKYTRYIPTHLRKYMNAGHKYRHQNTDNLILYGWTRILIPNIQSDLSESESKEIMFRKIKVLHRSLVLRGSADVVGRVCKRIVGHIETPTEGKLEATIVSAVIAEGSISALDYLNRLAESGIDNILNIALITKPTQLRDGSKVMLCRHYHTNSVVWLMRRKSLINSDMMRSMALCGNEPLLRRLLSQNVEVPEVRLLTSWLIGGGLMTMFNEINSIDPVRPSYSHVLYAAGSGNIEALEWLLRAAGPNSNIWIGNGIFGCVYTATIERDQTALTWLEAHNIPITSHALLAAVRNKQMHLITRVVGHRARMITRFGKDPRLTLITSYAVIGENLDIAQYLFDREFPFDARSYKKAAGAGKIESLQWLREKGVQCNDWAPIRRAAVKNGQIEVLDWMFLNKLI